MQKLQQDVEDGESVDEWLKTTPARKLCCFGIASQNATPLFDDKVAARIFNE